MELITYKKFKTSNDALYLVSILVANNIEYLVEDIAPESDLTHPDFELEDKIAVKLKQEDFEIVEQLLNNDAIEEIDQVEKDFYLFEFTDEELVDIVKNFDEWSNTDYILAQKILKERGKEVPKEQVDQYRESKLESLRQKVRGSQGWLILGYIFAFLGGIIGLFMGWSIITSRKTLPNGEVHYVYDEKTKAHGRNMFFIGIVAFIVSIVLFIISLLE